MEKWSHLRDAYGSATAVPELLSRLDPESADELWDEIWSRLCHQGGVYSASFAAIPQLVQTAYTWSPSQRATILTLIGAIFAGISSAPEFAEMRTRYAAELVSLQQLADETLNVSSLPREDFIHVLEAAMAFQNVEPWSTQLNRLVDGEFDATCPACGSALFIVVGEAGFFTSNDDYARRPNAKITPIRPANFDELDSVARSLHRKATHAGHTDVAKCIQYLFGYGTCAKCGGAFSVAERIAKECAA